MSFYKITCITTYKLHDRSKGGRTVVSAELITELKKITVEMRRNLLMMLEPGKVGHLGGSSSCMEILASLYFNVMNISKDKINDPERDIFIMSKGHSVPAQYAALAELGFFPKSEFGALKTLGGMLQGHPDMKTPGIEAVTGSLGQGLSVGAGIAIAAKYDKNPRRVYVLCGDGEMAEGQLWEAAAFSANYELSNLTMILDKNDLQASGSCVEVMKIPALKEKWTAFGWEVIEVDGHNYEELLAAFAVDTGNKPKAIIAKTIKGKMFPFAENVVGFHNGAMTKEQYAQAILVLDKQMKELN